MYSIPLDLPGAIRAIAELQSAALWLQGQSNLLLGFISSEPSNLRTLAIYANTIAHSAEGDKEAKKVAQVLLDGGLSQHLPPAGSPQPSGGGSPLASNVIQFPNPPKPPSDL